MIGLLLIAARNLSRNWVRTVLTVAGATVALIAFVMIRTVLTSWDVGVDFAAKDRLGTRQKVSFIQPLPKKYIDDVRGVPGIKQATWANWFGAKIPTKPDEFFASMAVDDESYLQVVDEMAIEEPARSNWLADKRGALVGDVIAKKMGWKVGDKVIAGPSGIYATRPEWEFNGSTASTR